MARIRFLKPCWNPVIGAVETDDLADVSDGMAHHLVQEAGVAEFVTVAQPQEAAPAVAAAEAAPKPRARRAAAS